MLQSLVSQKFTGYVLWRKRRSSRKCHIIGLLSAAFLITAALGASDLKERRRLSNNPTSTIERLAHLMDSSKTGFRTPRRMGDKEETVNAPELRETLEKAVENEKGTKTKTTGENSLSYNPVTSEVQINLSDGSVATVCETFKEIVVKFSDTTYKVIKEVLNCPYLFDFLSKRDERMLERFNKVYEQKQINVDNWTDCMENDKIPNEECLWLQGKDICKRCNGAKMVSCWLGLSSKKCDLCKGTGEQPVCQTCMGTTKVNGDYWGENDCPSCKGTGVAI